VFSAEDLTRIKSRHQLGFSLEALGKICFQAHSGCWLNPVPCGCRSEAPVFLLSAGGHSLFPEVTHIPPQEALSIFKCSSGVSRPLNLSDVPFYHQLEKTACC